MFTVSCHDEYDRLGAADFTSLARATAYFQKMCADHASNPEINVHLSHAGFPIATNGDFFPAWYDLTNEEQEQVQW